MLEGAVLVYGWLLLPMAVELNEAHGTEGADQGTGTVGGVAGGKKLALQGPGKGRTGDWMLTVGGKLGAV